MRRGSTSRPPQIAEVVREHAQLQPDFVRPEPMTRQSRPVRRLLPLFDPLLGRATLVVEPHDGAIGEQEIRHDEADARRHEETSREFRRIRTLCDFIHVIPVPLGINVYAKSGNADTPGFHAPAFAGGMVVDNRWAYFALVLQM